MDSDWRTAIPIPQDLNEVIRRGVAQGQEKVARRDRRRRLAMRSVCCLLLLTAVFIGGIRLSPAFAAAVRDFPVLGELVRVFGKNQSLSQGGGEPGAEPAALTMARSGDTEWIRLEFDAVEAARYRAELRDCPRTITITLPGTAGVEVLSEISRAKDTSQYIKAVYQLPDTLEQTTAIQLELECDADIQMEEYRGPGSLVLRLTWAPERLESVYSLRTLSMDETAIQTLAGRYSDEAARILRDDKGKFFLELAQFTTAEEAEKKSRAGIEPWIVEKRVGNNVPVCFETVEAYESSRFLDRYYQVLLSADTVEPVLDFLDQHFAQAGAEEQSILLKGLTGLLQDEQGEVDWQRVAAFYELAGQKPPQQLGQNMMR